MKLNEINKIIDNQIAQLERKLNCEHKNKELLDKIIKGKISTLKRLKNDFKTKFANSMVGEEK